MRAALFLLATLPAMSQQGPCTASGLVLHDATGAPVPRARIFFRPATSTRPLVLGYFSAEDGTFHSTGLQPIVYFLSVQKSGLLPSQPNATRIDFSRDCHPSAITLKLAPAAVISGHLSTPHGTPAAGARVEAQKRVWLHRRWQYSPVSSATSGALGDFRIPALPAGQYLLRAHPGGSLAISFRTPGGPESFVAPAYYPGFASPAQARSVHVDPGAELSGLDFSLLLSPLLRVSGRVTSGEALKAPAWCSVSLRSSPPGAVYDARYQASDGSFLFPEVPPGEYDLLAYSVEPGGIGSASRRISLDSSSLEGLDLPLEPPFPVKFTASLQGGTLPASGLLLRLAPLSARTMEEEPQPLNETGAAALRAYVRDRHRLEFSSAQPNIYLKSILAAGRALPNSTLDFSDPSAPRDFTLLLANDGGRLAGFASGMTPQSTAFAVLVPADLSRLAGSTLLTTPIALDGTFHLTSIPPGDYLVYSFAQPLGSAFDLLPMLQDPGWVPTFQGPPTTLRIDPNAPSKVQLSLQPPP